MFTVTYRKVMCLAAATFAAAREKLRLQTADQSGSVAVIAAVAFSVLIGGMGLGAEVGYWYVALPAPSDDPAPDPIPLY